MAESFQHPGWDKCRGRLKTPQKCCEGSVEGLEWERPSDTRCRAFRDILKNAGVSATLRLEKGGDIDAACGQLRLKQVTEEGIIGKAPAKVLGWQSH